MKANNYLSASSKLILIAGVLLNLECAYTADPGVTDTELLIGSHVSESGKGAPVAMYGKALAAYFDDVNAEGGVHGRKVKLIKIDTQSLPQKTVQATKTLVEEKKVFAIVGGQGPSHLPTWEYLIEKGVPDLVLQDFQEIYIKPIKKSIFTAWYTFEAEGRAFAEHIAANQKGKKVCWLGEDSTLSESVIQGSKTRLEELNKTLGDADKLKIGPIERTDRHATQASAEILKLKKENCEVVIYTTYGPIAASAINAGVRQNYIPKMYLVFSNITPKFFSLVEKKGHEGVIAVVPFGFEDGLGAKDFAKFKKFCEKHNIPLSLPAARGFYVAEVFTEALKRNGKNISREGILKTFENFGEFQCSLCVRPVKYSADRHEGLVEPVFVTVKDSKWILL